MAQILHGNSSTGTFPAPAATGDTAGLGLLADGAGLELFLGAGLELFLGAGLELFIGAGLELFLGAGLVLLRPWILI